MAATYNDLYLDARRALRRSGGEAAQLEARELLAFAAGKTREGLLRDLYLYAPDPVCERFQALLARALAGEPVAYLLGEWEFYGLTLEVCPDVLIPRPDTETLVEHALDFLKSCAGAPRVLDLCAGSGCVGLAVASRVPDARVVLGEWSEQALRVCRRNVRRCGLTGRVSTARLNALEPPPALFTDFDLVLSNPPYIPTGDLEGLDPSVRDFEPHLALDGGADGLDFYRAIAGQWRPALRRGGRLIFEIGYDQAPAVERILTESGWTGIASARDPGGHWRVAEAEAGPALENG